MLGRLCYNAIAFCVEASFGLLEQCVLTGPLHALFLSQRCSKLALFGLRVLLNPHLSWVPGNAMLRGQLNHCMGVEETVGLPVVPVSSARTQALWSLQTALKNPEAKIKLLRISRC